MPDIARRQEIDGIIADIIDENSIDYSSFDITKFLMSKYKFRIGVQNFEKNTTGVLLVDDDAYIPNTDTNRLIVINSDLGVQDEDIYNFKKRFIIAHEFAHFILHKQEHTQFAHRNTDKRDSSREKEAEYFARCLLMPQNLVRGVLSVEGIKEQDICAKANMISKLFSVTLTKAKQRIEELELA